MLILVHFLLFLIALPATLASCYLALLTLLSARPREIQAPAIPAPPRFDIIVPAHNESAALGTTLNSLRALAWPPEHYRVIVVADNCTDDTAEVARRQGVLVLERDQPDLRGKGYALQYAFQTSLNQSACDAVVVIDADSLVSPNLLHAFSLRLAQGAQAIQARHGVSNPSSSWRTRLAAIAYAASHAVRGRGRERLRVSCGLRGNGMCFRTEVLCRHPFSLNSLAEDLEYGVQLGLAGVRVRYADEALVDAEMASSAGTAASQRRRWEWGRFAVARQYMGRLLCEALWQRDRVRLDLALDLLTPPLGYLALLSGLLMLCGLVGWAWDSRFLYWSAWAAMLIGLLTVHVLRGWQLSGTGWRALLDLARVPGFIGWKLWAMARSSERGWVRTRRNEEKD